MAIVMRCITTDEQPLSLGDVNCGLAAIDEQFSINDDAQLYYGDELFAEELEVIRRGDEEREAELDEDDESFEEFFASLEEFALEAEPSEQRDRVVRILRTATADLELRVRLTLTDAALQRFEPLWRWFFAHRQGLMQVDGRGYFDASGSILEVGF